MKIEIAQNLALLHWKFALLTIALETPIHIANVNKTHIGYFSPIAFYSESFD